MSRSWQLHCYELGDYFLRHTDRRKFSRHYAPFSLQWGELLLYIGETSAREPNRVHFHIEISHECIPMISGRRFVLKRELIFLTPPSRTP